MNVIRNIRPDITILQLLPHFREAHMLIKCCSDGVNQFKDTIFGWVCFQTCSVKSSWGCVIHSYRHDECRIWLIHTQGDNIILTPSLVSSSEAKKPSPIFVQYRISGVLCRVMGVDTTPMPYYTDVTRMSRRLKSPATWLFVQQLDRVDNKENILAPHYWLFVR